MVGTEGRVSIASFHHVMHTHIQHTPNIHTSVHTHHTTHITPNMPLYIHIHASHPTHTHITPQAHTHIHTLQLTHTHTTHIHVSPPHKPHTLVRGPTSLFLTPNPSVDILLSCQGKRCPFLPCPGQEETTTGAVSILTSTRTVVC